LRIDRWMKKHPNERFVAVFAAAKIFGVRLLENS